MKAIVAVDKNWGIGKDGNLLVRIPEDMKNFKQTTINHVVIMGRKTMESMGCKPLKDRLNIVLTRNYDINYPGFVFVHSETELIHYLKDHDLFGESWVIGGSEIYNLLLKYCMEVHITKIDAVFEADTYFNNLDTNKDWWEATSIDTPIVYDGNKVVFSTYMNIDAYIQFMETTVFKRKLREFERIALKASVKNMEPTTAKTVQNPHNSNS